MKITVTFESLDNSNDSSFEHDLKVVLDTFYKANHKIINVIPSGDTTFDIIEKSVCSFMECDKKDLQSKTRDHEIVLARQLCHYISRNKHLGSFKTIGKRFGDLGHADVIHSNNTILRYLKTSIEFRNEYQPFIDSFK